MYMVLVLDVVIESNFFEYISTIKTCSIFFRTSFYYFREELYNLKKNNIFLILFIVVLLKWFSNNVDYPDLNKVNNSNETVNSMKTLIFYFPDEQGEFLTPYKIEVENDINSVLTKLIRFKKSYIPQETEIIDIKIIKKTAYITLNEEFEESSDLVNYLNIQSIIHTLCLNNLNIDSVQFFINNKDNPNTIGPVDIHKPLQPNLSLQKN